MANFKRYSKCCFNLDSPWTFKIWSQGFSNSSVEAENIQELDKYTEGAAFFICVKQIRKRIFSFYVGHQKYRKLEASSMCSAYLSFEMEGAFIWISFEHRSWSYSSETLKNVYDNTMLLIPFILGSVSNSGSI